MKKKYKFLKTQNLGPKKETRIKPAMLKEMLPFSTSSMFPRKSPKNATFLKSSFLTFHWVGIGTAFFIKIFSKNADVNCRFYC